MKMMKTVNDMFISLSNADPETSLFNSLFITSNRVNFLTDFDILDYTYRARSGLKILHFPFIHDIFENSDASNIAKTLWKMFGEKWKRLYDAIDANYNPLENEKYTINHEEQTTETKSKTSDHVRDITNDTKINESGSENVSNDTSSISNENERNHNEDYYFGFNSADGVNTNTNANNNTTDTDTVSRGNQDSNYESRTTRDVDIKDNLNKTEGENNEIINEYSDNKSGNNGRKTFQELLNEEIEVRKNLFYEIVFTDIDSVLTIPVY